MKGGGGGGGGAREPKRPPLRAAPRAPPSEGGAAVQAGAKAGAEQARLCATRAFDYGEVVLREHPVLFVPTDAVAFLRDVGSDAMLEASRRLGDAERLAAFAAFSRLPLELREAVLAMGVSAGSTVVVDTQRVVGMFLRDFPQLVGALDWELFARVVGVVSDRGTKLRGGGRALYLLSDQARHSCSPNAVIETLGENGTREVRVIAREGMAANEEITMSFVPEQILLQPLDKRREAVKAARRGRLCACTRCAAGDDLEPVALLLQGIAAMRKDSTVEQLRSSVSDLARLDAVLPFAMASKARLRARLAQACEENCRNTPGPMFSEAAELYEASLDETFLVLGQKGLQNVDNVKRRLKQVQEQLE